MAEDLSTENTKKPSVLSLAIKEKAALYAAYMPFIKGGGLFIPTNKSFKIGEEVFMILSLINDPEKTKVVGRVVWVSTRSQPNKPSGIGVQFNEKDGGVQARIKIENILGQALKSTRPTHTL